jgi:hypothetical protein
LAALKNPAILRGREWLVLEELAMNRSLMLDLADRKSSRWAVVVPALSLGLCSLMLFPTVARAQNREREVPARAEQLCQEEKIPFTVKAGMSLARVEVNGKPAFFIIDSAGTSVINSDHLALRVVRQMRSGLVTLAQDPLVDSWDVVQIASLRLGAEELHDFKMLSHRLPQLDKQLGREVDGILGADFLTRWDAVAFDYRHGTLRLGRAACMVIREDPLPPPPQPLGLRRP